MVDLGFSPDNNLWQPSPALYWC